MKNKIYIVFGVSGSGKTSVGKELANRLHLPFYDADDYHPEHNVKKMKKGDPLTDQDRLPWLETLAEEIQTWHRNQGAVLACSALKKSYRKLLESVDNKYIEWIHLDGSYELIAKRLESRKDHFFDPTLLQSQFDALELSENILKIDIKPSPTKIAQNIISKLKMKKSQLGLIGLGTMGSSLAKNMLSKRLTLSVFNRQVRDKEVDIAKKFVQNTEDPSKVMGFDSLAPFIDSLQKPRTVMLMVNAGKPVDLVIDSLIPLLDKGDCIIDGGNSYYKNTVKRNQLLSDHGIYFIGAGISGGEEGALKGPSIMPGGSSKAYKISGKFLEAIAAKDKKSDPCCTHVGPEGSGHFVKMVHNGIEYGEMQLLAEIYHLLRFHFEETPETISQLFTTWIRNGKGGFLIEITANILLKKEGEDFLIDKILDKAGQKGTGGWSTTTALELGKPLSTISESVMARNLSGMKSERVDAASIYQIKKLQYEGDKEVFKSVLEEAYYTGSLINHAIGFELMQEASKEYDWNLNLSEIARIWTNGCIIRSELMQHISEVTKNHESSPLLVIPAIKEEVKKHKISLQKAVAEAILLGCPVPVLSAAANYINTYTSAQSSANMIQAQRDYFGSHTFQRIDQPITEFFHSDWKNL